MKPRLVIDIPKNPCVALSGGSDSVFALAFLLKRRVSRDTVTAIHINHSTPSHNDDEHELFVRELCKNVGVELSVYAIPPIGKKNAEFEWSVRRREIFYNHAFHRSVNIVTGHNLDDAVEWWMIRAMQLMEPKLLEPNSNLSTFRPFLSYSKKDMRQYLEKNPIGDFSWPWVDDPTNLDGSSNMRSVYRAKFAENVEAFTGISSRIRRKYNSMKV